MSVTAMDLVASAKQTITEVDTNTVSGLLADTLILDVREPAEYAAGCLPNAINIPRGVLEFKMTAHPVFHDKQASKIVVYCLTGGRSALATEALNKIGYEGAVSMSGGFSQWSEKALEVVTP